MPTPASLSRMPTRAAAATTMVVLVAMSAAVPALAVAPASGGSPPTTAMLGEAKAVRAVAAAVAAVARDLFGGPATHPVLRADDRLDLPAAARPSSTPPRRTVDILARLEHHLLDLPPPAG